MRDQVQEAIREITELATDPNADANLRRLARSVLLLFQASGSNVQNNLDAFSQIAELGRRQGAEHQH